MAGLPIGKDNLRGLALSFIVVLVSVGLYLLAPAKLEDQLGIDFRLRFRGDREPHAGVAIISVDELSIKTLGRWPWDRDVHSHLIDWLTKAGAKAIAFDILFTEPDQCGRTWADESLGQAAQRSGRVIFGSLFHIGDYGEPAKPLWPIPQLQKPHVQFGAVNIFPESDGITRKIPVVLEYENKFLPSLSFGAYAISQGKTVEEALDELNVPAESNPWHEMLVDYVGDSYQKFPYYSFVDVVRNKVAPEKFKDKIVFVGGTAVGLFDFKAIPNAGNFPGVEIHANAVDNFLNRRFLHRLGGASESMFNIRRETALQMLIFGLLCGFLALHVPTWAGAISIALLLGYFTLGQWLFTRKFLVIDYVGPAFSVIFSYVVVFFIRFRKERTEKRWIKNTFAQYMSPKLVDVLAKNPSRVKLGGEDREMTVFFSDIEGFTSISESMPSASLVHLLNEYFNEMTEVVTDKYDGYVDKFIGDAIMAFWNGLVDQPDHAVLACLAALDQTEKLKELQRRFAERKLPHIAFRAGINTGHMTVGNMGSNRKFNYTVMGDTVNLASRLEGANKAFHTRLMISETTYEKTKNAVEVRPLDLLRVKGKKVPIQVFELIARKGALSPDQQKAFAFYGEGMTLYREKKFEKAIERFGKVLGLIPGDGPAKTYIDRCENFLAFPPPPTWDGVYVMTSK